MSALRDGIHDYAWHRYLPPSDIPDWFSQVLKHCPEEACYDVNEAVEQVDNLFSRLVAGVKPPYIVPVSGGRDSRLILAALREHTDDIVAVTCGRVGQLDFDLGGRIARAAGVEHQTLLLDDVQLEWETLKNVARQAPWTYLPDAFFISECIAGF